MVVPNDSVLLIDKPLHWSTFDIIRYLKKNYRENSLNKEAIKKFKIGHAGTLDPLATGLVIVCTGKETKNISTFQGQTKEYLASVTFGGTTQSYDSEFEPTDLKSTDTITLEKISCALPNFTGEIMQTPPIFSALKLDGKRAYKFARESINEKLILGRAPQSTTKEHKLEKKLQPRLVKVLSIEIIPDSYSAYILNHHRFVTCGFLIRCSKGTYIRSIAHDLGQNLGVGAYLKELKRTKIGFFDINNSTNIEDKLFIPTTKKI